MPTTKLRNILYHLALPLKAVKPDSSAPVRVIGHPVTHPEDYRRLLNRHHVLGSASLLSDGQSSSLLLRDNSQPSRSVRPESLFRVASITKMATALAALVTAERGLLDPEAPIRTPLDPFLPAGDKGSLPESITLIRLLSHTSGIADPPGMESALLRGDPFTDLLPAALKGTPGTFRYSNFGFGLVGCLLEAVWNQPVPEILDRLVFSPLGMRASLTASSLPAGDIVPISRVLPYDPGAQVSITPLGAIPLTSPDPLRHYGHTAGAMYTDIRSLERMIRCLMVSGAPLLQGPLGAEISRAHAVYGPSSPRLSYGLGLLIIQDPSLSSHRILGHQGFAYGCVDGAFWEEDTGRSLIFLNGGASEYRRHGRLGWVNEQMLSWAFGKELPSW